MTQNQIAYWNMRNTAMKDAVASANKQRELNIDSAVKQASTRKLDAETASKTIDALSDAWKFASIFMK